LLSLAVPSIGLADLIDATVLTETPTHWHGYIDWTQPTAVSSATIDGGPMWAVSIVDVPVGGPLEVLSVSAWHLFSPHGLPDPLGVLLVSAFGPLVPGASADLLFDTKLHEDDLVSALSGVKF
jgi:hypothetical protein